MKILNDILKKEPFKNGVFITIKKKIIKWYLNMFVADKDEYYDYQEPPAEKMKDKIFWVQIIDEHTEKEDD